MVPGLKRWRNSLWYGQCCHWCTSCCPYLPQCVSEDLTGWVAGSCWYAAVRQAAFFTSFLALLCKAVVISIEEKQNAYFFIFFFKRPQWACSSMQQDCALVTLPQYCSQYLAPHVGRYSHPVHPPAFSGMDIRKADFRSDRKSTPSAHMGISHSDVPSTKELRHHGAQLLTAIGLVGFGTSRVRAFSFMECIRKREAPHCTNGAI